MNRTKKQWAFIANAVLALIGGMVMSFCVVPVIKLLDAQGFFSGIMLPLGAVIFSLYAVLTFVGFFTVFHSLRYAYSHYWRTVL